MDISTIEKHDSETVSNFSRSLYALSISPFSHIPQHENKDYITDFSWGNDMGLMICDNYRNETCKLNYINASTGNPDNIIFKIKGVPLPLVRSSDDISVKKGNVFQSRQDRLSVIDKPSKELFKSIIIRASRQYLNRLFGKLNHPALTDMLHGKSDFSFQTPLSFDLINTANEMLNQPVPKNIESQYFKLKCEELLMYVVALLIQGKSGPTSGVHIDDVKVIYAVKCRLQLQSKGSQSIASLVSEFGMGEKKMRKLFKQTFGKGVFEYYQSMRMKDAAKFLKEKNLTVSEVGYLLGFTNLSHFSRVFEQHHGIKPKKFSLA